MDAEKLGMFIAETRKERHMTQAELAEKLHVTDKAVSKWERGLGFPDIKTIEPLADALGVSVMEIMRAERIMEPSITHETASEMLIDTFELVKRQREIERKHMATIFGCLAAALGIIFIIDHMTWIGLLGVFLPVLFLVVGIVMFLYSFWRRKNQLAAGQSIIVALLCLLIPVVLVFLLFFAGVIGIGPVQN